MGLDKIKQKLVESVIVNDTVENDDLKKKAEEVEELEKLVAEVIKECENIIKTKKKGIACVAYYQGKVFKKFKNLAR